MLLSLNCHSLSNQDSKADLAKENRVGRYNYKKQKKERKKESESKEKERNLLSIYLCSFWLHMHV